MDCTGTSTALSSFFFLLVFKVKVYMQLKWIQVCVPKLRISRLLQKTVEFFCFIQHLSSGTLKLAKLQDVWKWDFVTEILVDIWCVIPWYLCYVLDELYTSVTDLEDLHVCCIRFIQEYSNCCFLKAFMW